MWLKINRVLAPFLDCLHEFDLKKAHMMLDLMFGPRLKDLYIMNNYMGKDMATIVATRYDFQTFIPLLCSTYQKVNVFAKPIKMFIAQEQPLVVFNAGWYPNDIAIEHVKFYIRNCWFMDSKWKMFDFCISIYSFSFIVKFIVFGIWFCIHNFKFFFFQSNFFTYIHNL